MNRPFTTRCVRWLIVALGFALPHTAQAEKLTFDHRLYPPLKAVLDGGDAAMIDYNGRDPRYVVDLIAVKGRSTSNWTEALEIIVRLPGKNALTAREWASVLQASAPAGCRTEVTAIAEDTSSITFAHSLPDCPKARAETTFTRIVQGKRSLFMLSALIKGKPDEATRVQWLALLASAHIE